ncbi:CNNM domain-containing protein, partial [Eggerthella lenta]|uniref:CNNM domain-containing protein n=1 Tax=Eggerthella lenta TaxID=84112 RepID=UPI0034E4DCB1|nr:hypothetical protein [Eggerthella lenta]
VVRDHVLDLFFGHVLALVGVLDAERVSKMVAGPLMVFQKIASPLVALTSASANGLSRLFGIMNDIKLPLEKKC